MHARAHWWILCMVVFGVLLLTCGAQADGQQSHGAAHIALIAWMPDSFTVRWPGGITSSTGAGVSLRRGVNFRFGGSLLPGANVAAACEVESRGRNPEEKPGFPMVHASKHPSGVLECDGAFRIVSANPETEILDARPAEARGAADDIRIDVRLSVI
jgi:hypothetical protein